ncbi:unnamed protein product [Bursaphelenchus okinawaensis]|uniref:Tyrosine-protein kinase n=1 Tax=Bursaphelenchus okinawaensis TaxID=465554 RepID=A0A811K7P1_9BILA|nr:unnamed protein product [Bursaphelenchus okinawaensis]CAG9094248.1 unnamed protein product [Bursaphelenchus okinawaensis]
MWFKKSKPSKSNTLLNKPGSTPRAQSPVRQPKELAEQSTSSGVSEHQSDETKPAQRSKKKTFRSKLNREDGSEDGGASQQTQEENQNSAVSDLFAKLGKRKSRRPKKGSTESADHKEEKSRGSKETVKGKENDTNREKTKYDPKVQEAEIERLATKKWYHGLMPRDEIEEMLRDDGDFCVRTSDVGHNTRFIMSIMWKNKARHMVIGMNTKKEWYLKTEQGFATIDELIVSFIANKTVLHKEGTMLKRPILRPSWYILHDSIKLFKKVGGGSFGDVFMAELQLENKVIDVAVKILKGEMGKKERSAFMKEASINRKFNHPNIVRLLGVAVQLEPMMVVLELAPNGSLRTFVKTKTDLTVSQLTYYLYNAAKGLAYLAELGVIHRDIAARNCLLSDDYTVKISDFGLSVAQSNLKENKLVKMPVRWLAPETLISRTFSLKTDVWSYGVMVWEVYSRCKTDPWPGKTNAEARAAITNGQTMEMPSEAPDYGVHVMKECWIQKPEDRITMAKVVRELKKIVED